MNRKQVNKQDYDWASMEMSTILESDISVMFVRTWQGVTVFIKHTRLLVPNPPL